MPDEVLIKSEHLSKKFCRSLKRSLWYAVRDISHSLTPWNESSDDLGSQILRELPQLRRDEFWALRDVSFEVRRGECLGLVGHNGAGKSTLLKILNSLNRPDSGQVAMRGRIGALIELSAGFNPILSGRENIFNQAAILGFSKQEIDKKFDAIVDFSELEEFLDMPVQNYSSGMKVKLGFAVSSQMEPDILLIDEVLAVGDLGFRFKCLDKMADLLRNCAVVFVSHSMPQIMRVATNLMVLKGGQVEFYGGDVSKGLEAYFELFGEGELNVTGSGEVTVTAVNAMTNSQKCYLGESITAIHGDRLRLEIGLSAEPQIETAIVQVLFWNHEMIPVLDVIDRGKHGYQFSPENGSCELTVDIDDLPLNSGRYQVSVIVTHPNLERVYCQMDHAISVTISTGSPASGAGCISLGKWQRVDSRISIGTRSKLVQRAQRGEKISQNDSFIFDELGPGDIAVDCGANVGVVTEIMAARGAVVHAFEPDPSAYKVLIGKYANVENVVCHNQAVSNAAGSMNLYHREERAQDLVAFSVGSTLNRAKTDVNPETFTKVDVIKLSEFIERFEHIRLLKLDIEGSECDVLEDLIAGDFFERIDLTLVETHEEWIPETIPRLEAIRRSLNERGIRNVFLNWI